MLDIVATAHNNDPRTLMIGAPAETFARDAASGGAGLGSNCTSRVQTAQTIRPSFIGNSNRRFVVAASRLHHQRPLMQACQRLVGGRATMRRAEYRAGSVPKA